MSTKRRPWRDGAFFDFSDKNKIAADFVEEMLNRTQQIFKWTGLPDTIPQRDLELSLQYRGVVGFLEHNGDLWALTGFAGGPLDPYYMPTIFTVANPALDISKNYQIGDDCEIMPNDSMWTGLMPMARRYASLMAENLISIRTADINARIPALISVNDDRTKIAAEAYLRQVEEGRLGILAGQNFLDAVQTMPYTTAGTTGTITDLIELQQYLRASWFNDLGLNSNYNMKRESLNATEAQMGESALLPFVDDMLNTRKKAIEKINAKFGTNIAVELASGWQEEREEPQDPAEEPQEPAGDAGEEGDTDGPTGD